jgi:uncharacterized protein YbjT (DUF2867 family)
VARVLIVGCGCRGRELAGALGGAGHAVRGTTRDDDSLAAIEAAGAEAVLADPDRLSTLLPHLDGVSTLCWLMGTATGEDEALAALHGTRLESIATKLIDTHVRGLVYEAAGTVAAATLAEGAETARRVGEANRMPVEIVESDPAHLGAWTAATAAAVERVLSA